MAYVSTVGRPQLPPCQLWKGLNGLTHSLWKRAGMAYAHSLCRGLNGMAYAHSLWKRPGWNGLCSQLMQRPGVVGGLYISDTVRITTQGIKAFKNKSIPPGAGGMDLRSLVTTTKQKIVWSFLFSTHTVRVVKFKKLWRHCWKNNTEYESNIGSQWALAISTVCIMQNVKMHFFGVRTKHILFFFIVLQEYTVHTILE